MFIFILINYFFLKTFIYFTEASNGAFFFQISFAKKGKKQKERGRKGRKEERGNHEH